MLQFTRHGLNQTNTEILSEIWWDSNSNTFTAVLTECRVKYIRERKRTQWHSYSGTIWLDWRNISTITSQPDKLQLRAWEFWQFLGNALSCLVLPWCWSVISLYLIVNYFLVFASSSQHWAVSVKEIHHRPHCPILRPPPPPPPLPVAAFLPTSLGWS